MGGGGGGGGGGGYSILHIGLSTWKSDFYSGEEEGCPGGTQHMLVPESFSVSMLSLGPKVFPNHYFWHFEHYTPIGNVCLDEMQLMLLLDSNGVCISNFRSVALRVCLTRCHFCIFFDRIEQKKECGNNKSFTGETDYEYMYLYIYIHI